MLAQGKDNWPEESRDCVTFMEHNYFDPQPVYDTRAFSSHYVAHNLTNADLVRLFQAIVPALEKCQPGTPLLINDTVLSGPDEAAAYEEYELRQMDLAMYVMLDFQQRTASDFRRLLRQADSRFEVRAHFLGTFVLPVLTSPAARQSPRYQIHGATTGAIGSVTYNRIAVN